MRALAVICLTALLSGCATSPPAPPMETVRKVAGGPDEVLARIQAASGTLGLSAQPGAGPRLRLVRASAPAEWADCPTRLVRQQDDDRGARIDFAAPQARSAAVDVGLAGGPEGTTVSLSPHFAATYRDIYRNLSFTRDCTSLGVLERSLLDAAG